MLAPNILKLSMKILIYYGIVVSYVYLVSSPLCPIDRTRITMSHKILITGTSGGLGGRVLGHLLKTVPAEGLIAFARDPMKVDRYATQGVNIRQGDLNDPASLDKAFAGVGTLVLIATTDVGPVRLGQKRSAVDAAKRANVRHVLYLGVIQNDEPGHDFIVLDHQIRPTQVAHLI